MSEVLQYQQTKIICIPKRGSYGKILKVCSALLKHPDNYRHADIISNTRRIPEVSKIFAGLDSGCEISWWIFENDTYLPYMSHKFITIILKLNDLLKDRPHIFVLDGNNTPNPSIRGYFDNKNKFVKLYKNPN